MLDKIIDKNLLKTRKDRCQQDKPSKKQTTQKIEPQTEKKWFQKPMVKEKFIIKEKDDKFYAQYDGWPHNVWVGAYNSLEEVDSIINIYVKETKKKIADRKFKNVHSIIIDLN